MKPAAREPDHSFSLKHLLAMCYNAASGSFWDAKGTDRVIAFRRRRIPLQGNTVIDYLNEKVK